MTRRKPGLILLALALLLGSCGLTDGFADRLSDDRLSELEDQLGGTGQGSVGDRATAMRTATNDLLVRIDDQRDDVAEVDLQDVEKLGAYFGRLETILEDVENDDDAFLFTSQLAHGAIPTVGPASSQALSFSAIELTNANALGQLRITTDHLRSQLSESPAQHFAAGYASEHTDT